MNLVILSFFRNSAHGQAQAFLARCAALRDVLRLSYGVRVIAVYGDCVDNTADVLQFEALRHGLRLQLVEHSHGGPVFGSTEEPARLRALSALGNAGLASVGETDDLVWYVESDLQWDPTTVESLAMRIMLESVDVIAPLCMAGAAFYDIFVFRKSGHRFGPFYPYHGECRHDGQLTRDMDSVGSAFLMRGYVARECRIINDACLIGFGEDVRAKGYTIACDASQIVRHP
jgi:hypothetical protein